MSTWVRLDRLKPGERWCESRPIPGAEVPLSFHPSVRFSLPVTLLLLVPHPPFYDDVTDFAPADPLSMVAGGSEGWPPSSHHTKSSSALSRSFRYPLLSILSMVYPLLWLPVFYVTIDTVTAPGRAH